MSKFIKVNVRVSDPDNINHEIESTAYICKKYITAIWPQGKRTWIASTGGQWLVDQSMYVIMMALGYKVRR